MTHVAQSSAAGGLSIDDRAKFDSIATGATANSSDATLLARANHTGNQPASTISDPEAFPAATTSVAGNLSAADKTKLNGVATAATANATDADLRDRTTHTGTQAANTVSNPEAFPAATISVAGNLSSADKTKLDGVATAATANSADATLLARANHTGTQTISTISDPRNLPLATTTLNGLLPFADKVKLDAIAVAGGDFDSLALGGRPWFVPNATTVTLPANLIAVDSSTGEPMKVAADTDVLITTSGVNGRDAGSEAADTWYYIWLIKQTASPFTVAGLLSTSSTSPTMPSGYTHKRLIGAVRNDGSSDFRLGHCSEWGGGRVTFVPSVKHGYATSTSGTLVGSGLAATSFTDLDASNSAPLFARFVQLWWMSGGAAAISVREKGVGHDGLGSRMQGTHDSFILPVRLDAVQVFQYRVSANSHDCAIFSWTMELG